MTASKAGCAAASSKDREDPKKLMMMRDSLQHYLEQQEIYAPVYWRLHSPFGNYAESRYNCSRVLCLPVDQRYTREDMQRVADAVNEWQALQG